MDKKYWKGVEELTESKSFIESKDKEFGEDLPVDQFLGNEEALKETSTGRRDFLKFLGFSVAAATVASCEVPVIKSIPYVNKPEDIVPGVANWYASTYYDGSSYASILIKTREGRPIHIKGNADKGFTGGATNPRIIASVLSLYDKERLQNPLVDGKEATWQEADEQIISGLDKISKKGGSIVLLTNSIISPSTEVAISKFKARYGADIPVSEAPVVAPGEDDVEVQEAPVSQPQVGNTNVEHVTYDAVSYSGVRKANLDSFGAEIIPSYDFSKAKTIVSIGADFLNSWILPTEFQGQYVSGRNPDGKWMSRHYQFETNMSMTGSNADVRGMIKPSEQSKAVAMLHEMVTGQKVSGIDTASLSESVQAKIKAAAVDLKSSKGASLVVAGSNDKNIQVIVNAINNSLSNYGKTIDLSNPIHLFKGDDTAVLKLVDKLKSKKVDALIMYDVNPVYTMPNGGELKEAIQNIGLTISLSRYNDESASLCKIVCPDHHALESWNDFMPKANHYAVQQPVIRPLFNTAAAQESFLVWGKAADREGKESMAYYKLIQETAMGLSSAENGFEDVWNKAVHDSCMKVNSGSQQNISSFKGNVSAAGSALSKNETGEWEVMLYQKAGIGIGEQAGNPWLQELPDPVSKVTWDNYITMSPSQMKEKGYQVNLDQETPADMATITVGETTFTLPVYAQPGQTPGTVGIALGYGRGENGEKIGKAAYQSGEYGGHVEGENGGKAKIGENGFRLASFINGTLQLESSNVTVSKSDKKHFLATTQIHHTVMGRGSIIKEVKLSDYKSKEKGFYNHDHELITHEDGHAVKKPISEFDLWNAHPVENVGHRWGMSIDLNACIGCGSCLVSCQSENNVPVVGKDEVRRGREMHWLRLDRYYSNDSEEHIGKKKEGVSFGSLEDPSMNPKVVYMPMMCQHCNHAPCETVCPVLATTHSNEGLNQMTYNRCIGTRYCANNCPYKVRRFNWFNYQGYKKFTEVNPAQDDIGRMVLNPDVTVRARGVMEKCSFCVQKIQEGKLQAKKEGRPVKDGDVTTACSDACPANAIIVGDWNDENSKIRKASDHNRAYNVLEEIGVKPNIWYQTKVRNEEVVENNNQEA